MSLRAANVMTQQYVSGELSLLLAQLRAVATSEAFARDIATLRREAETLPPTALVSVTARALAVSDRMCWDSVSRGDAATFSRQCAVAAALYEFGICSGLLAEASPPSREREVDQ
jgi:hypothetical protein